MTDSSQPQLPRGAALYLAVVQFFFVTTWTIYVIYLPKLLAAAGLPASYTIWILILDQLVFMVMDVVMGIAADRAGRVLGRIGPLIIAVTAVSCIAFLLIPHAAFLGSAAPAASLVLILAWAVTSSALRAPPWVLLSKYAAAPSLPWMNALALSGIAIGGALAPYLGVTLRNVDPRLPFAVSSLTLFAATAGLVWVERALARRPTMGQQAIPPLGELLPGMSLFLIACLLLALGFQIHTALNSAPQYLRFAAPAQLDYLLPVFWIGFNVAMFPGAALARRFGTLPVIAVAAALGAGGAAVSLQAHNIDILIAGQVVAGGAWGCIMMAGFSAALAFGRTGREGTALGLLFGMLAIATLSRMGAVAAQLNQTPDYAVLLAWGPVALWLTGAVVFIGLAVTRRLREATN
jgi:MFS family permease